jgi:hypothetical protein
MATSKDWFDRFDPHWLALRSALCGDNIFYEAYSPDNEHGLVLYTEGNQTYVRLWKFGGGIVRMPLDKFLRFARMAEHAAWKHKSSHTPRKINGASIVDKRNGKLKHTKGK